MVVAMLLENMLDDLGCQIVATVARPNQAMAAIETHDIDAAILDVNLDGQDSYGIAAMLAARGVPFIFSTGYGQSGISEKYRDHHLLQKPFRMDDLVRELSHLLDVGVQIPTAPD